MKIIITLLIFVTLIMAFASIACCKASGNCSKIEEEIRRYESYDNGDNGTDGVN